MDDWLDDLAENATVLAAQLDVDLDQLLVDFVAQYGGMQQRGPEWYAAMATTVGGSEIAAIMGKNPYATIIDVIMSKIIKLGGGDSWTGGGPACWWGTLFEDNICAYVELDIGSKVLGDNICIQELPGHRNSPDGYIVARFYRGADGRLHLWTTDMNPSIPPIWQILMLEFKCPMSRKPKSGKVPPQYRPQLHSGLMVSPVAHRGLYVDAVFRKCGIMDLKDTPEYDTEYHFRDRGAWSHPIAWGMMGVYAPLNDAPRWVRHGWRSTEWKLGDPDPDATDADAAQAAWDIHSRYFGLRMRNQHTSLDVADLGDMDEKLFDRALSLIDRRLFRVVRSAPCFADGRGSALQTGKDVGAHIEALRTSAPPHHFLLGVIPWKLFETVYVPVDRHPNFIDVVRPLIDEVHATVTAAIASGDSDAYMLAYRKRLGIRGGREWKPSISDDIVQDLFESIAAQSPPATELAPPATELAPPTE